MVDRSTPITTRVIANKEIAHKTYELEIEKPDKYTYFAGQYIGLRIPTVSLNEDHEHPDHRFFSPLTAPHEPTIRFVTRIRDTGFKQAFENLTSGDFVEISDAVGDFVISKQTQPIVFIAGGVGVSPVRSMVLDLIARNELKKDCFVFCVNRSPQDAVYNDEFLDLERKHSLFKFVEVFTQVADGANNIAGGHLETVFLEKHLLKDIKSYQYLVVGSHPFANDVIKKLENAGVSKDQIRHDRFCGYWG